MWEIYVLRKEIDIQMVKLFYEWEDVFVNGRNKFIDGKKYVFLK